MEGAMRLGIFLSSGEKDPEGLAQLAREAEALGFESLWVPDHVLKVMGPILDPIALLAFLAGITSRIKLGTSVLVVPYRNPVVLANELSSLDVLSRGRMRVGVGVGWSEEEFEALGMKRSERGSRTDEVVEAMQQLWKGSPASFSSRFYEFSGATIGTVPFTTGGPQILVGGQSDAALRRALRYGHGWNGIGESPERILEIRNKLSGLGQELGRDPQTLELTTVQRIEPLEDGEKKLKQIERSAQVAAEKLKRLARVGVEVCILSIPHLNQEKLSWAADEVRPRLEMELG